MSISGCLWDHRQIEGLWVHAAEWGRAERFSPADSMFTDILACITLLDLHEAYISYSARVLEYHTLVKQRPNYKVVTGNYFNGWKKYHTLFKTSFFLCVRTLFRKYGDSVCWVWGEARIWTYGGRACLVNYHNLIVLCRFGAMKTCNIFIT